VASAGEAFSERLYADDSAEHAALDIAVADARMTSMAAGGTWSEMSPNGTEEPIDETQGVVGLLGYS
jgi:hypothetical protein